MDKRTIRAEIRKKRRALSPEEIAVRSERICRFLQTRREYQEAELIYAYLSMPGEVCLDTLLTAAWQQGKRTAVPRVHGREMTFYLLTNLSEVEQSPLGIREPRPLAAVTACSKTLFLMPGIAFDRAGNRVGQGGGYYDRYLSLHPMPHKWAVAFDFQVCETLPVEPHDIRADAVITECGNRVWQAIDFACQEDSKNL